VPKADFSDFPYFPSLRCSDGEHIGYRKLDEPDKDKLLPIFQISQHGDDAGFDSALKLIGESAGERPFILDMCREQMPAPKLPAISKDPKAAKALFEAASKNHAEYMAARGTLMNPTDGYANWRSVIAKFPNAIPTIIIDDNSTKNVLREAMLLSNVSSCLAIRLTRRTDEKMFPVVAQIASMLESVDHLLIILDAGYSRVGPAKGIDFATGAITKITGELDAADLPLVRAVYMSSSFPDFDKKGLHSYDNHEWAAWKDAIEYFPFGFGDYAGVYRHPLRAVKPRGWTARVVFPRVDEWLAFKGENSQDRTEFIDGAIAISKHEDFKGAPDIWGTRAINQAAKGDITGLERQRDWVGVKVNIHLHQQVNYAPDAANGGDDGDE
jgi:hypothetical protein